MNLLSIDDTLKPMRESGRTLIETLAVLGIMAVMTVGAVAIYTKARTNLLRMQSVSHINEMADDIQTLYSGRANYEGLSLAYLERMGVIKKMTDPFGEEFSVYPVEEGTQFAISYQNLSQGNCMYLSTLTWENAEKKYINGSVLTQSSDAITQCLSDPVNTVSLYFK